MNSNKKQNINLHSHDYSHSMPLSGVDKVAFHAPLQQSLSHKATVNSPLWAKVHETSLEKANVAHWQAEILHHMDPMAHMKPAKAGHSAPVCGDSF